jgi:hypothetical protein
VRLRPLGLAWQSSWSYEDVLPLFKRAENNEQFTDGFARAGPR